MTAVKAINSPKSTKSVRNPQRRLNSQTKSKNMSITNKSEVKLDLKQTEIDTIELDKNNFYSRLPETKPKLK